MKTKTIRLKDYREYLVKPDSPSDRWYGYEVVPRSEHDKIAIYVMVTLPFDNPIDALNSLMIMLKQRKVSK